LTSTVKALLALCVMVAGLAVATAAQAEKGKGTVGVPRGLFAAVHADVTIINAKAESRTITWDRGQVTALSHTSISLQRKDGKTVTLTLDGNTKTRGSVAQGKGALVVSSAGVATHVLGAPARAKAVRLARAKLAHGGPFGIGRGAVHVGWSLILADGSAVSFALDRGQVTAASSTSVTTKRADNQSVTLTIDGHTKVRTRHGNAIQVGDKAEALSQGTLALVVVSGPGKKNS
jgi:hypothetical protein